MLQPTGGRWNYSNGVEIVGAVFAERQALCLLKILSAQVDLASGTFTVSRESELYIYLVSPHNLIYIFQTVFLVPYCTIRVIKGFNALSVKRREAYHSP